MADPATDRANATIFVENIPFTMTNQQLEALFSDVAPVKLAFVRGKTGTELNTGVGYVKFAMPQDAEAAIKKFNGIGHRGRILRVSLSKRRPPRDTRLTKIKSAAEQEAEAKANGQAIPKSMKKAKADAEEGEDEAAEHSDSESVEDAPQASSKAKRRQAAVEPASGKRDAAGSATKATGSAAADGKKSKTYVYHKAVEAQKLDPEKALALSKMTRKERYEALLDATDSDPDVRTIIISEIPETATERQIYQKARKSGKVISITYPLENVPRPAAYVTYATLRQANDAVKKIHLHQLAGGVVSAGLKRSEKSVLSGTAKNKAKEARLIIRNLSFKVDEHFLSEKFHRFGKLVEVKVVRDEKNRSKGFGFIQFNHVDASSNAINEMNGVELDGRKIAVDWAVSKSTFERAAAEGGDTEIHELANVAGLPAKPAAASPKESRSKKKATDENDDDDEDDDAEGNVDDQEEDEEDDVEEDDLKEPAEGEDEDENEDEEEEDSEDADVEDGEAGDEEQPAKKAKAEPPKPPRPSDVGEGRTVFIQNLSFDVENENLAELFQQFGALDYALVVRDKETGESRGTGFVKFKEKASADACLARASSQVLDPLELDSRPLRVTPALDKATLETKAKQNQEQAALKKDRRRHYLIREGHILKETAAYQEMSETDRLRREQLMRDSKEKMKNPNFAVSLTRLSVHNIPRTMNSKQLKQVFIKFAGKPAPKEAFVVMAKDRLDSDGNPVSMCYGFAEYDTHEAALAALRAVNNNPQCFTKERRPIVMFAWDDNRIMRIKKMRSERIQQRQAQLARNAMLEDKAAADSASVLLDRPKQKARPAKKTKEPAQLQATRAASDKTEDEPRHKRAKKEPAKEESGQQPAQPSNGNAAATEGAVEDGKRGRPSGAERRRKAKEEFRKERDERRAEQRKQQADGKAKAGKANRQTNGAAKAQKAQPGAGKAAGSRPDRRTAPAQESKRKNKAPKRGAPKDELDAVAALALKSDGSTKTPRSRRSNREAKEEAAFDEIVSKYRRKLEASDEAEKTRRWFE